VGCCIWYNEGPGWAAAPLSPLLAVPIVTAHPSAALYINDGPLLCGVNVVIKGSRTMVMDDNGSPNQPISRLSFDHSAAKKIEKT